MILFFILGACQSSLQNEITIPQITHIKGSEGFSKVKGFLYYEGQPYSGYLLELYPNDRIKSKAGYWKGKQEGIAKGWHLSGKPWFERYFHKGKKVGIHKGWWKNNQLKFKYYFVDGGYDGKQVEFHQDGAPAEVRNYVLGKEEGKQTAWSVSGKLVFNYVMKNNKRYGLIGRKDCTSVYEE